MFLKTRKTTLENADFLAKQQTRHLYLTDLMDMLFSSVCAHIAAFFYEF